MGFAKHGYVNGVGTWSTYINNMTGSIGSRSQLLVHSDIGSNGTAGCVGVELGGRSGTDAERRSGFHYRKLFTKQQNQLLLELL